MFCAIRVGGSRAGWSTSRAARARRARPGDHRAGRDLLRAAHDPGDDRAGRDRRRARARRVADQLHQPRRHGHRGLQQVLGDRVVGICDSPSRAVPARRRARSAASPADMWFDYFGLNHLGWLRAASTPTATACPSCSPTTRRSAGFEEGRLFGGDWLRALGMIPNEYLYYFYFGADTVDAIRKSRTPRGAYLLESQARLLRPATARRRPTRSAAWRATRARARPHLHGARRAAPPASSDDHDDGGEAGGYEGEAMAVVEAIANNTRAIMILNTANRSALPFLDEHAVVEVPAIVGRTGPVPVAIGADAAHAQALVSDQGRRAHDDRGGPERLDRAGGARAGDAPAGAERQRRARHLRRLPRAAARARRSASRMSVDVVVTATAFMDITFIGLESVPRPGEERFARRPPALARRRRHQRDRRLPPRPARRARRAARRGPRRPLHPRGARARGHRAVDHAPGRARRPPWSCPGAASAPWSPTSRA